MFRKKIKINVRKEYCFKINKHSVKMAPKEIKNFLINPKLISERCGHIS